jgi:hypothetical protein
MQALVDIYFPTDNYVTPSSSLNIKWNTMSSFNNYEIQVANNIDFSSLFLSTIINGNNITVSGLVSNTTYYTRVRGKETGATSEWSPIIKFRRFTPTDLANQQLWLSSDLGITQAGGFISSWTDQSAKANHAVQASAPFMPQFVATEPLLNGKPTVKLDGADDFLQFNEIANSRSIFIVLKHTTGNQSFAALLGHSADLDITSGDGTAFFVDPGFFNAKIAGGEIRINKLPPPANM